MGVGACFTCNNFVLYRTFYFFKNLTVRGWIFHFFYLVLYNYHSSFLYSLFLDGDLSCKQGCQNDLK